MSVELKVKLSRLRDIGWREWDPIGLLSAGKVWDQQQRFADEYDDYLRKVAGDLCRGGRLQEAIEYLLSIEREYMAIGFRSDQEARAEATVHAIHHYMTELSGGRGSA